MINISGVFMLLDNVGFVDLDRAKVGFYLGPRSAFTLRALQSTSIKPPALAGSIRR